MNSSNRSARVAGTLYILASLVGAVRLIYIPESLVVSGNPAVTVDNIAAHEWLFRVGIVSSLIAGTLWIFVPLALYRLFKDVDQSTAILMVILGTLMQVPIFFINSATDVATLLFAKGTDAFAVFSKPERDALAVLFLRVHHHLDLANAVFWGLWLVPFGLLVYRSRILPRFLGVWLMLGCLGYLAFSFTGFLLPAREDRVFNLSQPLTLGEVAAMLWLVIRGARDPQLLKGRTS